jgi:hypothetical protein
MSFQQVLGSASMAFSADDILEVLKDKPKVSHMSVPGLRKSRKPISGTCTEGSPTMYKPFISVHFP